MLQQKWQLSISVPTPPVGSSTLFNDLNDGGKLKIKLADGSVVEVGGDGPPSGGAWVDLESVSDLGDLIRDSALSKGTYYKIPYSTISDMVVFATSGSTLGLEGFLNMRMTDSHDSLYPGKSVSLGERFRWGNYVWVVTDVGGGVLTSFPFDYDDPNFNNDNIIFASDSNPDWYFYKWLSVDIEVGVDEDDQLVIHVIKCRDDKGNTILTGKDTYDNYVNYLQSCDWASNIKRVQCVGGIMNVGNSEFMNVTTNGIIHACHDSGVYDSEFDSSSYSITDLVNVTVKQIKSSSLAGNDGMIVNTVCGGDIGIDGDGNFISIGDCVARRYISVGSDSGGGIYIASCSADFISVTNQGPNQLSVGNCKPNGYIAVIADTTSNSINVSTWNNNGNLTGEGILTANYLGVADHK